MNALKIVAAVATAAVVLALSGCAEAAPKEPPVVADPIAAEAAPVVEVYHAPQALLDAISTNPDTIGWLTIPGTGIDAPVQQGWDNDKYLRRDELGQADYRGCIFADYEDRFTDEVSPNTVIYGHTFDDGYMGGFAELANYSDQSWADQHQDIILYLPGQQLTYRVYAAGAVNIEDSDLPIMPNLTTSELAALLRHAERSSVIEVRQPAAAPEKVITLITCNGNNSQRFIVVGCLLNVDIQNKT